MTRRRREAVTMWLYVEHPITGNLCSATIKGDQAVYDFWCGDEDHCTHEHGGWFEYVRSADDILDRLPHLGRLRVKAVQ